MTIIFTGSQPVHFAIKDKQNGKVQDVVSCRVTVETFKDGHCVGMDVLKATPDFANWASEHIGDAFDFKAVACDTRGRACTLYDVGGSQ